MEHKSSTHGGYEREGRPSRLAHRSDLDLVRLYLDEIGQRSLLDRDDEARLGEAVQAGVEAHHRLAAGVRGRAARAELARLAAAGERARGEFVEANLRLVVSVAKRYRRPGVELLDLVQAGNVGLLRAVERFDWRLGNKFSTYATWWIRQGVIRELSESGRSVRLPVHLREQIAGIIGARDRLRAELGHEPSVDDIADAVEETPTRVEELLAISEDALSLSLPVGDGEETELGDLLPDTEAVDPAERTAGRSERQQVRRMLEGLTDHQASVVRLRFGLDGSEPRSLEAVGRELGISRERVRQVEARALRRLRTDGRAEGLRPAS